MTSSHYNDIVLYRSLFKVILLMLLTACGSGDVTHKPVLSVVSPPEATRLLPGDAINITVAAASSQRIARIDAWISGVLVASEVLSEPALSYTALLQIPAPQSGEVHVTIIALTESGISSDPVNLTLAISSASLFVEPNREGTAVPPAEDLAQLEYCELAAQYLADITIPDGSTVQASTSVTKVWRIRNTSQCDWGATYTLNFVDGAHMGAPASVPVSPTAQHAIVDVSVPLITPAESGIYTGTWRMYAPDGRPFGNRLYVVLRVP